MSEPCRMIAGIANPISVARRVISVGDSGMSARVFFIFQRPTSHISLSASTDSGRIVVLGTVKWIGLWLIVLVIVVGLNSLRYWNGPQYDDPDDWYHDRDE